MSIQHIFSGFWYRFTFIDRRSFAVFRIGLAISILLDVFISRFPTAKIFLSDSGILPRKLLVEHTGFSLLFASGSVIWVYCILCFLTLSAVCVLIGYYTRFFTIVSYILLLSIHWRAEFVLGGPDRLHLLLFMWAIFLPLGAYASVDAIRTQGTAFPRVLKSSLESSLAVFGIILLTFALYAVAAYTKLNADEWYSHYTTLYYVLQTGYHANGLGYAIRNSLLLTQILTAFTLFLEWCIALTIVIPFSLVRTRVIFCIAIVLLNIGFGSMLYVSLFPVLGILLGLLFMPTFVWDALSLKRLSVWGNTALIRMSAVLPKFSIVIPSTNIWSVCIPVFLLFNIVIHIICNIDDVSSFRLPENRWLQPVKMYIKTARLDQSWFMFRNAPHYTSWPEIIAHLQDGSQRDVWRQQWQGSDTVSTFAPDKPSDAFLHSLRYFYVLSKLTEPEQHPTYEQYFGYYQCVEWNKVHETKATVIEFFINYTHIPAVGEFTVLPRESRWRYACPEHTLSPSNAVRYTY